jgi:hypothetical protein
MTDVAADRGTPEPRRNPEARQSRRPNIIDGERIHDEQFITAAGKLLPPQGELLHKSVRGLSWAT